MGDAVRLLHFVRGGVIHLLRHQNGGATLIPQRAGPGSILTKASVYSARYLVTRAQKSIS